ncbi:MAG: hypothetical protein HY273_14665 [Gammaproteobacteria bacterium]|nr:hypothetical protein [Gammaproteobacteria bacterium]
MSFRVVLQQYLASMRERDELDLLLPELLTAMGHAVLSRPQRGSRQGGVDCLSEFQTGTGPEAYLFILKQNDVDRRDFFTSPQGIEPSVREAKTDYIRTRLPKRFEHAPKHIILVSNGRMKEVVVQNFASLTKEVSEQPLCDLNFWGDDKLAELIEEHLFHDALLLGDGRSQLRKAIATTDRPDIAIGHIAKFFGDLIGAHSEEAAPTLKTFLKQCSAAMMGWIVFNSWCRTEGNLKPAVITGEYLLLSLWSSAQRCRFYEQKGFIDRHDLVLRLYTQLLLEYYDKVLPQLLHARALRRYRPTRMQYLGLVFDEMGRVATLLLLLASQEVEVTLRVAVGKKLANFFDVHEGCLLPYFDGQSIDLSLALAAFMSIGATQPTTAIIEGASMRLRIALDLDKYLPIDSDSLDDALSVELKESEPPREFFELTTLVPMLATVSAAVGEQRLLDFLREQVLPKLRDTNLERWFPMATLEISWGASAGGVYAGVSRSVESLGATCADETAASINLPPEVSTPEAFEVVRSGRPWLLAMSARHFRHPLPTWYFSKCIATSKAQTT